MCDGKWIYMLIWSCSLFGLDMMMIWRRLKWLIRNICLSTWTFLRPIELAFVCSSSNVNLFTSNATYHYRRVADGSSDPVYSLWPSISVNCKGLYLLPRTYWISYPHQWPALDLFLRSDPSRSLLRPFPGVIPHTIWSLLSCPRKILPDHRWSACRPSLEPLVILAGAM